MRTDTTEIEKKSLEAHVELCAERYRYLEEKLETLEGNIASLKSMIHDVHGIVHKMAEKINDQLINWGMGLIGFLIATTGYLITNYVLK
jgi:prefoldin subunit 5